MGSTPSSLALVSPPTTSAAAPSDICEEFPAVTVVPGRKDRLEPLQSIDGDVRPRPFVGVHHLRIAAAVDLHRDRLVAELPCGRGLRQPS